MLMQIKRTYTQGCTRGTQGFSFLFFLKPIFTDVTETSMENRERKKEKQPLVLFFFFV